MSVVASSQAIGGLQSNSTEALTSPFSGASVRSRQGSPSCTLELYHSKPYADLTCDEPPARRAAGGSAHPYWTCELFVYAVSLFVALSEILTPFGGGAALMRWRGEKWIKELDYVYFEQLGFTRD